MSIVGNGRLGGGRNCTVNRKNGAKMKSSLGSGFCLCRFQAAFWPRIDALQQIPLGGKQAHTPSLSPFASDKAVDKLGTDAVIH
jgi:hypothetical protein